jgi:hypothetical protein
MRQRHDSNGKMFDRTYPETLGQICFLDHITLIPVVD